MQFSFNFLPDEQPPQTQAQAQTQAQHPAPIWNTEGEGGVESQEQSGTHVEERALKVIARPHLDLAALQRRSTIPYATTTVELKTASGGVLSLRRVREENPEDAYDLVPGKYEGGSKIWECSLDLAQYVLLHLPESHSGQECPGSVLELGCGHGLPAIAAMIQGYSPSVFLDFNDYVITSATWPSIVLNCPDRSLDESSVLCLGGDWKYLTNDISSGKLMAPMHYNLILSAETLYTVDSCRMVYHLLQTHLAPGGFALIASKKYYFGVGGGTMELQNLVAQNRDMQSTVVFTAADGRSNVREIIEVRKLAN